jgi:SAM-dependent methyltransferase
MGRRVQLRELLVGIEGLALLRHLVDGTDADAGRRIAEVRLLLSDGDLEKTEYTTESDARSGYAAWSQNYDEPGNPVIALEEPVVWSLVAGVPPGRALDAACGTGRHARHLLELGHEVTGVDLSPEMLTVARAKVPGATFREADLRNIPGAGGEFDLVVCGLALALVAELGAAVAELSRVLRPGGHLVVSVLHPFQAYLGWHAPFADEHGRRHFVREHTHRHGDYLAAFAAAGLTVRACLEPELTADEVQAKRRAYRHIPEATTAAYLGLPAVLVWDAEKAAQG